MTTVRVYSPMAWHAALLSPATDYMLAGFCKVPRGVPSEVASRYFLGEVRGVPSFIWPRSKAKRPRMMTLAAFIAIAQRAVVA